MLKSHIGTVSAGLGGILSISADLSNLRVSHDHDTNNDSVTRDLGAGGPLDPNQDSLAVDAMGKVGWVISIYLQIMAEPLCG